MVRLRPGVFSKSGCDLKASHVGARDPGMRYSIVLFFVLMQSMSQGAPPLTTIQDTLYKADGTPFEGVLTVNWKSFEGPDASNVPTNTFQCK